jgi:DNA-binding transcriptional ArsR family regulator
MIIYNTMVVDLPPLADDDVDRLFGALAHATRRDIVRRAMDREHTVSELASTYDVSFAAIQRHVAVLEAAHLVVKRAEGRERMVRADPTMLTRARALLHQYELLWRDRIDRLDALLAEEPTRPPTTSSPSEPPTATSTEHPERGH